MRMILARIMRAESRKMEKIALKAKRACIQPFSNPWKILENPALATYSIFTSMLKRALPRVLPTTIR
jgi:hypothetical protein